MPASDLLAPASPPTTGGISEPASIDNLSAGRLELLEVDHLSYHYPVEGQSGHRGIEAISFQVRRGEFVVITGGVGSWKSTLARAMVGLLPKSGGEVRWNGQPVENPGEFFRPPRCAYLSQIPRLFSQSVKENILQGIPEDRLDDLLISRLEMRRLWKGEIG